MLSKQETIAKMNQWGGQQKPFLFILDFELKAPWIFPLNQVPRYISYNINGVRNDLPSTLVKEKIVLKKHPIDFSKYKEGFNCVQKALQYGNTYLLNLTYPTPIDLNLSLEEVYRQSVAKYKLLVKDKFVVFSPEPFVKISEGILTSYPMKGTIDVSLPQAEASILSNKKEQAEHATIVDLIRNDMSSIAKNVQVANYRYVEKVVTNGKNLLQVSSKIQGSLPLNYLHHLGDIIFSLVPAGSISGAPKKTTLNTIREAEKQPRGYFTGVVGIFDGKKLDSGVMIRFIEKKNNQLLFRSGGGITAQSNALDEYQEMLDKVYVPIN